MKGVVRGMIMGAVILSLAGLGSVAEAQAPAKIAFVNARGLLVGMPGYAQAESTFTKELETGRAEIQRLQVQFDSAAADFEQSQAMLSPSNRTAKRKELETKSQALQQRNQEIQNRLGQRERDLLLPMQERLTSVIEGIRAEGNYALILDLGAQNTGIITYDKSLDITDRVAQRLKTAN